MKLSGNGALAILTVLVLALAVPALAQNKASSTIYNKPGAKKDNLGVIPLGQKRQTASSHSGSTDPEQMSFAEWTEYRKAKLHSVLTEEANQRAIESQAEVQQFMAQELKRIGMAQPGQSLPSGQTITQQKKTYVYNPNATKKDYDENPADTAPDTKSSGESDAPFRVFKFNKKN